MIKALWDTVLNVCANDSNWFVVQWPKNPIISMRKCFMAQGVIKITFKCLSRPVSLLWEIYLHKIYQCSKKNGKGHFFSDYDGSDNRLNKRIQFSLF